MNSAAIAVVICAYNSRDRIDIALESLYRQDLDDAFEIIAVVSGGDGCARYLAARHPRVRVLASGERLHPGRARNIGVKAARAPFVAFLADDCAAAPTWLRSRLGHHHEGARLVAGAIANGTPRSLIGTADYYVEYSASMPIERLLRRQPIPHTLSYERDLIAELGWFPELDVPGEDTVFNARCVAAGIPVVFEPRAWAAHRNIDRLRPFLRHQASHGRGLARCIASGNIRGPFDPGARPIELAVRTLLRYPTWRMIATTKLIARYAPKHATRFAVLSPLIGLGYLASGLGAFCESRAIAKTHGLVRG